eukprot:snap_masked-scaffold_7-processed-gene-5.18-mRNA-1 protein AED:1.00 eAED:1.00 QI:0/0/0/0/1/1/3/0/61
MLINLSSLRIYANDFKATQNKHYYSVYKLIYNSKIAVKLMVKWKTNDILIIEKKVLPEMEY